MTDVDQNDLITSRRAVLGGVAAVGASAVLAACGSDDSPGSGGDGGADSGSGGGGVDAGTNGEPGSGAGSGGGAVASTSDVPVGSGAVFQDAKVVITQPKEGEFKAFSAVCTHQGCTVNSVKGDTIQCNCHGSQFSTVDGSVKRGPATKGLATKKVTVDGDNLSVS